jgi:hypothetical protein
MPRRGPYRIGAALPSDAIDRSLDLVLYEQRRVDAHRLR